MILYKLVFLLTLLWSSLCKWYFEYLNLSLLELEDILGAIN